MNGATEITTSTPACTKDGVPTLELEEETALPWAQSVIWEKVHRRSEVNPRSFWSCKICVAGQLAASPAVAA